MLPIHPGVLLERAIVARGSDPDEFIREAHIPRRLFRMVLAGERPISFGLAMRLGRILGTSPWVWIAFQERFDKSF